jgi:hypothetical protein
MLRIKNWDKFQHYRDRKPPWIKLATDTFQDPTFARLQPASKLLAICIWTLASRSEHGTVIDDSSYIREWGMLGPHITNRNLEELINKGFLIRDASNTLAPRKQSAIPETETEADSNFASKRKVANSIMPPQTDVALLSFPLNDHSEFPIFESQADEWKKLFPAVDVIEQLRLMRAWCLANPTRRKTKSGILRFVTSWLAKEQNGSHNNGSRPSKQDLIDAIRKSRTMPDFGRGDVQADESVERQPAGPGRQT